MKFRYARHTNDLNSITEFYTNVIGLEKMGSFENHSGYNGVFLGFPNMDWHLEFTVSNEKINHIPNDDDLLVFYLNSQEDINAIAENAKRLGAKRVMSKNPYWNKNAIELQDPDNYGVILTIQANKISALQI